MRIGSLSGSLTQLIDATPYLIAGNNITIASASNGAVTISATGGTSGGVSYFDSTTNGSIFTTGSAAFRGAESSIDSPIDKGANVFFYVSGSINGTGGNDKRALFGGDVVISGSLVQGLTTTAAGLSSHAEGLNTLANREYSHAEGSNTATGGIASHAEGYNTVANGDYSHAEGEQTTASGLGSHTEGYGTTASNNYSHAEGSQTTASGELSHAEGDSTTAAGTYSHAEGTSATSTGDYSHAEGDGTTAAGGASHAEGYQTISAYYASHAEGYRTIASANYSHTEGAGTIASGTYQHVSGKYNKRGNNFSLFIVGDGTSDSDATRGDILRINSGSTIGAGRVEVTGSFVATLGLSGSLTKLTDGTSYLIAGSGISITTGSLGAVTLNINDSVIATVSGTTFTGQVGLTSVKEKLNILSGATGTVTHDCSTGYVFYHSAPVANFTANFTNFTSSVGNGFAASMTLIVSQSSPAYLPTAVQLDGNAQTINWLNSNTPIGNANKKDIVSFSVMGISSSYVVLGQLATFG